MIVTRVGGGLGNQFFQYAIGRHLSLKHATTLYLDKRFYDDLPDNTTRRVFNLDDYNTVYRTADAALLGRFESRSRLNRLRYRGYRLIKEKQSYDFEPAVLTLPKRSFLWGSWQNEAYFASIRGILQADLSPKRPVRHELLRQIRDHDSVMVHVRRGDYTQQATNKFDPLTPRYFQSAAERVHAAVTNPVFYVFSDDLDWCRRELALGETVFVPAQDCDVPTVDFELMRSCRHFIVANSSFSWWAAWLGDTGDSLITAPAHWSKFHALHPAPATWERL